MNERIKNAFNGIRAEDQLKRNTLRFLQRRIGRQTRKKRGPGLRQLAFALALVLLVFTGALSHNLYFAKSMHIDLDINPSMALSMNRFGRIIGVHAYNEQGEELAAQLALMHKSYDHAVRMLTEAAIQNGFLSEGGLVSITLQSGQADGGDSILKTLRTEVASTAQRHHASVQIEVFPVDSGTRERACEQNLSPAKYLAILALREVAPGITMEGCRNHSIDEIRTLTQKHCGGRHGGGHHGGGHR